MRLGIINAIAHLLINYEYILKAHAQNRETDMETLYVLVFAVLVVQCCSSSLADTSWFEESDITFSESVPFTQEPYLPLTAVYPPSSSDANEQVLPAYTSLQWTVASSTEPIISVLSSPSYLTATPPLSEPSILATAAFIASSSLDTPPPVTTFLILTSSQSQDFDRESSSAYPSPTPEPTLTAQGPTYSLVPVITSYGAELTTPPRSTPSLVPDSSSLFANTVTLLAPTPSAGGPSSSPSQLLYCPTPLPAPPRNSERDLITSAKCRTSCLASVRPLVTTYVYCTKGFIHLFVFFFLFFTGMECWQQVSVPSGELSFLYGILHINVHVVE